MWELVILDYDWYYIVYSFFVYSFFGWVWETSKCSIQQRRFINRGFLNGPIIPIYGFGGTIIFLLLHPIKKHWYLVFFLGIILATLLEYITSVLMEVLFHAKWWDYSENRFNFQGRICLLASIFWGFLSMVDLYVFAPFLERMIGLTSRKNGEIIGVVFVLLLCIDFIITVIYTIQLDHILLSMQRLREEFSQYLIETSLADRSSSFLHHLRTLSIEGVKSKSIGYKKELLSRFQGRIDKNLNNIEKEARILGFRKELEDKFVGFFARYNQSAERGNYIHRRLLRAFPNIKSKRRQGLLEDLRSKFKK